MLDTQRPTTTDTSSKRRVTNTGDGYLVGHSESLPLIYTVIYDYFVLHPTVMLITYDEADAIRRTQFPVPPTFGRFLIKRFGTEAKLFAALKLEAEVIVNIFWEQALDTNHIRYIDNPISVTDVVDEETAQPETAAESEAPPAPQPEIITDPILQNIGVLVQADQTDLSTPEILAEPAVDPLKGWQLEAEQPTMEHVAYQQDESAQPLTDADIRNHMQIWQAEELTVSTAERVIQKPERHHTLEHTAGISASKRLKKMINENGGPIFIPYSVYIKVQSGDYPRPPFDQIVTHVIDLLQGDKHAAYEILWRIALQNNYIYVREPQVPVLTLTERKVRKETSRYIHAKLKEWQELCEKYEQECVLTLDSQSYADWQNLDFCLIPLPQIPLLDLEAELTEQGISLDLVRYLFWSKATSYRFSIRLSTPDPVYAVEI